MTEYLTRDIKNTQFYKIMFEMYSELLRKNNKYRRFFREEDEDSVIETIDNIINEYLLDQVEQIMRYTPTIVQSIKREGIINNKDEDFSSDGMGERDCPFKDILNEEDVKNKIIRRVVEKKEGKKIIRTLDNCLNEVFLTEIR